MVDREKARMIGKILQVIRGLQTEPDGWVNLAKLSVPLAVAGVNYKELGYAKLGAFLNEFAESLDFMSEVPEGGAAVRFVRPKGSAASADAARRLKSVPDEGIEGSLAFNGEKYPGKDSWLFRWASIPNAKLKQLADLALEEKWYYGDGTAQDRERLPILRNYLAYTFKRLCFENKIVFKTNMAQNEEYAAFNTGLVDRKYESIYALFQQNTFASPYWYLLDFVVAGEDKGKILVRLFNPLPERADYFENKTQNMLYDTTTGDLSCDFIHIIVERTERLPKEFLLENCPDDFLSVDGVNLRDVYDRPMKDPKRKAYFIALGQKIKGNSRILNRLKNRIEDAVDLALKRVEWNYKTAIPMYFPARNTGSLLLPLSLVDEDVVDLALVVERQESGAYQGQTILSLPMAYMNSRLVTRPDSDWLKTDLIPMSDPEGDNEE